MSPYISVTILRASHNTVGVGGKVDTSNDFIMLAEWTDQIHSLVGKRRENMKTILILTSLSVASMVQLFELVL